jgi:hypothetical protein
MKEIIETHDTANEGNRKKLTEVLHFSEELNPKTKIRMRATIQ